MSKQKIEKLERLIADKSISADEKKIYKEALDKLVKKSVTAKRSAKKTPAIKTPVKYKKSSKYKGGYTGIEKGLTYFLDDYKWAERDGKTKIGVEAVGVMGGKLRQDTFYIEPTEFNQWRKDAGLEIVKKPFDYSSKTEVEKAKKKQQEKDLLDQLAEMKGYKKQLEDKKIAPSKIIGTGFKNPRKSAFAYLDDQIDKLETQILEVKEQQKVLSSEPEEDFDCDELIEEEKKRVADRRKRYKENKSKRESTKNVERTNKLTDTLDKSIKKRLESGKDVSKTEIEKLIKEVTEILNMLKKALKKAS